MLVGPCIPVGVQPCEAEVGPTSGPIWRLSHLVELLGEHRGQRAGDLLAGIRLGVDAKVIQTPLSMYGEPLMKYTKRRLNDFNAQG